jgi:hypothetical protein
MGSVDFDESGDLVSFQDEVLSPEEVLLIRDM